MRPSVFLLDFFAIGDGIHGSAYAAGYWLRRRPLYHASSHADGEYRRQPGQDHNGQFRDVDRDCDRCHRCYGGRLGWQQLHHVGERRLTSSQSRGYHDLYCECCRCWGKRVVGYLSDSGSGDTGSCSHRHPVGKPRLDNRWKLFDFNRNSHECDCGDDDRVGWQHLSITTQRRHTSGHTERDRNLYGQRNGSRRQSISGRDRDGYTQFTRDQAERDHRSEAHLDRRGPIFYVDRVGNECDRRDGDRFGR